MKEREEDALLLRVQEHERVADEQREQQPDDREEVADEERRVVVEQVRPERGAQRERDAREDLASGARETWFARTGGGERERERWA